MTIWRLMYHAEICTSRLYGRVIFADVPDGSDAQRVLLDAAQRDNPDRTIVPIAMDPATVRERDAWIAHRAKLAAWRDAAARGEAKRGML